MDDEAKYQKRKKVFEQQSIETVRAERRSGSPERRLQRERYLKEVENEVEDRERKKAEALGEAVASDRRATIRIAEAANNIAGEANEMAKNARWRSWIAIGIAVASLVVAFLE